MNFTLLKNEKETAKNRHKFSMMLWQFKKPYRDKKVGDFLLSS